MQGNNTELRGGAHARLINGPERDLALFREAFNKTRRRLYEYVCVKSKHARAASTVYNTLPLRARDIIRSREHDTVRAFEFSSQSSSLL